MIYKKRTGMDFRNAVAYDLDMDGKHEGKIRILKTRGLYLGNDPLKPNADAIVRSFDIGAEANTRVKKKVRRFVLSLRPGEADSIADSTLQDVAVSFLSTMRYGSCQYMITRHYNTDNPHLHIITSAVDENGKRVDDYMDYNRASEVCLLLSLQKGFMIGLPKSISNCSKFSTARERERYNLARLITCALFKESVTSLNTFEEELNKMGITYKRKQDKGYAFKSNSIWFKGAKISKCFSLTNLKYIISHKNDLDQHRQEGYQAFDRAQEIEKDGLAISAKTSALLKKLDVTLNEMEEMEKTLREESGLGNQMINNHLTFIFLFRLHDLTNRVNESVNEDLNKELTRISDDLDYNISENTSAATKLRMKL